MSRVLLLLAAGLAAFAAVNLALSALVVALWRLGGAGRSGWGSRCLFLVRTFPAAFAAVFVGAAFVPAFLAYEPPDAEAVGLPLGLVAAAGLAVLARGAFRAARGWRDARSVAREGRRRGQPLDLPGWAGNAYSIDAAQPSVFVAGWRRPALFVTRSVAGACTAAELAAIAAHETAHVAAWDNAKRLVLRALPDFLGMTPTGAAIERAWGAAVEDEADAATARSGRGRGLDLASAIVKVSRLACGRAGAPALGSPLAAGPIERRVLRLAGRSAAGPGRGAAATRFAWIAALTLPAAVPLHPPAARALHALTEVAVRWLGCA